MNALTSGGKNEFYRGIKGGFNIKVYQQHLAVLSNRFKVAISLNSAMNKNTCCIVGKRLCTTERLINAFIHQLLQACCLSFSAFFYYF